MSIRTKRLQAEFNRLTELFDGHERIRIIETVGEPPERYILEYSVKGLAEEGGVLLTRHVHRAEIVLGRDYPRELPRCRMLTPVFHPNIDHLTVCTQDFGSAGESLAQLVVRVGEMISFQAYNTKSPRNGDAARWTEQHIDTLPLDAVDLMPSRLSDPESSRGAAPAGHTADVSAARVECANCNATCVDVDLSPCDFGHIVCADCSLRCSNCDAALCVLCNLAHCVECAPMFCADCAVACSACSRTVCLNHISICTTCGSARCRQCSGSCSRCGEAHCLEHLDAESACQGCIAALMRTHLGSTIQPAVERDTVPRTLDVMPPETTVDSQRLASSSERRELVTPALETPSPESDSSWRTQNGWDVRVTPRGTHSKPVLGAARLTISKEDARLVHPSSLVIPPRRLTVGPPTTNQMSRLAIAALVVGALGVPVFGILLGPVAVALGVAALREMTPDGLERGRNLARAGVAIGVFDFILWLALSTLVFPRLLGDTAVAR